MTPLSTTRRFLTMPLFGALCCAILTGCGGGGGGGQGGNITFGRTYTYVNGAQFVVMSVDSVGRFTIVAKESAAAQIAGAQGGLASDGRFFAQSSDGSVQFNGAITNNSTGASGTVQRSGVTVINFTASQVTPGAATDALSGTYSGSSGGNAAIISVDLTGHATLLARVLLVSAGGLVNIAPDGTFTSADGCTTGQLTANGGSNFTLRIDKLGCSNVNISIPLTKSSRAKWTFMVYINAANNLEEFGPLNVNQMETVGSTSDVNIVVQWKQAICFDCGSPDWVSTRRYFITKDNDNSHVNSHLIQDLGSGVNMGDWRTLRTFVTWAQNSYPADHYALVVWNHGAGWRPTRSVTNKLVRSFPRSVSIDDSTNSEIQIWELPQALNVTPQLDMLIFDASLMQMTEVAYEVRNSMKGPSGQAGILVGSEESPPGEGYPYDRFLADLAANPSMTAVQLGQQIAQRTIEAYGNDTDITQSVVDLTKMQNVADKLSAFGTKLESHLVDSHDAIITARQTAQNYKYPENKDLWDYAQIINANTGATDLKSAATDIQAAIQAAVLFERHGTINGKSHGLAIYVPAPTDYLTSYTNLALGRTTNWPRFLQDQPNN